MISAARHLVVVAATVLVAAAALSLPASAVEQAGVPCTPVAGAECASVNWSGLSFAAGAPTQVTVAARVTHTAKVRVGFLKTPSANIQCDYAYSTRKVSKLDYLRCGVGSGLKPPEPKPAGGCGTDSSYAGNRVFIRPTGTASAAPCAGDAGPFGNPSGAKAVPYGTTWKGGSEFSCISAFTGLTCHNQSGHGFFLSRDTWRLF